MSTLFALLAALTFGTIDYIGGHQSKKYKVVAVSGGAVVFGLFFGILMLVITHTWEAPTFSTDGYFVSGILAGTIGFLGLNAFFAGLSTGKMGVVSAISSLSTIIPVSIAIITGEKPHAIVLLGMVIAIVGGFMSSGPEIKGGVGAKPILYGIVAAILFGAGVYFMTHGAKSNVLLTMTTIRIRLLSSRNHSAEWIERL
jgi:drug/metabolite transporter (DMT)-like permease